METESRWDEPFYNAVREWMISLLSLLVLNMLSYLIIQTYRQRSGNRGVLYADEERSMAYRISLWMSVFTLSISIGAVLLLPVSIMMEEIYSSYRDNEYIGWLNPFLIQRLWNRVFICSNLCLFVLMPFAYFLTEAEGFSGWRKGIMSRVFETSVILILLALCTAVLTQLGIAFWSNQSPFIFLDHWSSYFEFLYSIISVLGVLLTLLCTPIGFTKMFSVVSSLLAKPQFLTDLDGDIHVLCLESDNVHKRLQDLNHKDNSEEIRKLRGRAEQLAFQKRDIERQQSASAWQRNVFYPLTILYVLLLTAVTMIMVLVNILRLLVMEGALPVVSKAAAPSTLADLGKVSGLHGWANLTFSSTLDPVSASKTTISGLSLEFVYQFLGLCLWCMYKSRRQSDQTEAMLSCIYKPNQKKSKPCLTEDTKQNLQELSAKLN